MDKFEQLESEYNKDYDPYVEKCPYCGGEDSIEDDEDDETVFYYCSKCGARMELQ